MGILNPEDLENHPDDYITRVFPKVKDLQFFLKRPRCKIIVEDRLNEIDVQHEISKTIPSQVVKVLNIAGASDADHDMLVNIFDRYATDAVFLLKNIDKASGERIKTLINCAMKADCYYPAPLNGDIDFGPLRIVATCCGYPDYLQGDLGCFIVAVEGSYD